MIQLTLGYTPDAIEQSEILRYVDGCTEFEHPKTKYGSAKLHIEYAAQVSRSKSFANSSSLSSQSRTSTRPTIYRRR